jgi:hypothetical protein
LIASRPLRPNRAEPAQASPAARRAKHAPFRRPVNPFVQKHFALPKFGFVVCFAHPGSPRGAIDRRHVSRAGDAVDAAASGARGAGRAGYPREPEAARRRTALTARLADISAAGCIALPGAMARNELRVRQNRVVLTVECYGQAERRCSEPNRAKRIAIREATGAIVPRSPGRSRHKPSSHRAGKAGRSAAPVCRCAAFFRVPRTADRGCQAGTRPSLRPCVPKVCQNVATGGWIRTARCRN